MGVNFRNYNYPYYTNNKDVNSELIDFKILRHLNPIPALNHIC